MEQLNCLSLSLSLLPFKDDHLVVAENTGNFVHLVSCIAGENEAPRLIVPNTAFIFHLTTFGLRNISRFLGELKIFPYLCLKISIFTLM